MKTPSDRQQRIDEFNRLFALLPGPKKVDRIRQAQAAMGLASEKHVRRYIMTVPDRAPNWQGIRLLRAKVEQV